jgi:hypothetical protein
MRACIRHSSRPGTCPVSSSPSADEMTRSILQSVGMADELRHPNAKMSSSESNCFVFNFIFKALS